MRVTAVLCVLVMVLATVTGCGSTKSATNFNGLTTPAGKPVAHMSTSKIAVHILGSEPLWGDASLETTVADFTQAAQEANGKSVRIVQSRVMKLWLIFPPFSIFLTPVLSNVAGDVIE